MRIVSIAGNLAFVLLMAPPVCAQDVVSASAASSGDERDEIAMTRHRAAVAAFARGAYREAVAQWMEANELRPSPAISFNVAKCYERLGDDSGALAWYRDYLYRAKQPSDQRRVARRVEGLEKRLLMRGVQQVTARSSPSGAVVRVDGQQVGLTPWTGDIAPGFHTITTSLARYEDTSGNFDLPKDHALALQLTLTRKPREVPLRKSTADLTTPQPLGTLHPGAEAQSQLLKAPRAPEDTRSSALTVVGAITLGAGALSLGAALVFEILRSGAESDASHQSTQLGFADGVETAHSRQTFARIFAGVGAGLVVTGGAVLLLSGSSDDERSPATRVAFSCPFTSCGASLTGGF